MNSRALTVCLAMLAVDAAAGGVYKCVDGGATTYQSTPCTRGQAEVPIKTPNVSPQAAREQPAAVPVSATQTRKRGPWTRTSVEIGISDDEVLNMPGWGRPKQISRTRVGRAWEEVWRYGDRYGGERELRFLNARLSDIVETPPALASSR